MRISKNKFVVVAYDLNAGEGDERELMERATAERPLKFIFGTGSMLSAFENNLKELEPGEKFNFSIFPESAYGEYNDDFVVEIPKKVFEVDGKFDDEYVKEGATLPMLDSDGARMMGSVLYVKEDLVVMDFNHPLAGETLHFSGEVLDVHEPTEEEILELNRAMNSGCGEDCSCGDYGCEGCGDEGRYHRSMNTFGNIFKLTSFGESHGEAVGGVVDGCPAGITLDFDFIQNELDRRRPGQSAITTPRKEPDRVEFLSGIYEGKTTGTPIGFTVRNENQHSSDYEELATIFRPSHADFTYCSKYGGIRDHRGGGRSSARETVTRVVAGAIAKLVLKQKNITVRAYTSQIGNISLQGSYKDFDLSETETNAVRCPDPQKAAEMIDLIRTLKSEGDSIGGIVACVIKGVPAGVGEPVFGKLQAALAAAMFSINAVKGFDYGDGFDAPLFKGSEHNDEFFNDNGQISTRTNYSGGIQGGISNGQDIYFRVAFKATATILREQNTVDIFGDETVFRARGRHDPCVVPRAVPVVESMAAVTLLDYLIIAGIR
jgi:chorismate synthase